MSSVAFSQLALFTQPSCSDAGVDADPLTPRSARSRQAATTRRSASPSLKLCVLGSGSGGNCTAVRLDDHIMLIDAGFGPNTTRRRLAQAGVRLEQVRAICLTHLDQDHFRRTWPATLARLGIRVFLHRWHRDELARIRGAAALFDAGLVESFDDQPTQPMPGIVARGVRLQHDRQGTIGYRFEAWSQACGTVQERTWRLKSPRRESGHFAAIGYATDLGHAPASLIEHLRGVDLLCLESNYDEHMTIHSSRPTFVNRRNMSDSGHLSNEQAFDALQRIASASPHGNPRHVLLMHRSSQCNHPRKVRRVFERDPQLARRVTLTEQRRRTRWFHVKPMPSTRREQMVLFV